MNTYMGRNTGRGPEGSQAQGLLPCALGVPTLLAHGCVHQPRSSLNPMPLGFLWRRHHVVMVGHNSVSSPSPLSRGWGLGLKVLSF